MRPTLAALVDDWTNWLNIVLANDALPLHACRSPNDAGNEHDPSITKACLHVNATNSRDVPAMIGLLCAPSSTDNDSDDDDDDEGEGDDEILGNDVFEEQIVPLCSAGPFFCFIARGKSQLTFYYCEDGNAGRHGLSEKLDMVRAHPSSFERGTDEQDTILAKILISGVTANLAQVARAAMLGSR